MTGVLIAISLIAIILFIGLTLQAVEIKKLSSQNKELNDIYSDFKKKSEDSYNEAVAKFNKIISDFKDKIAQKEKRLNDQKIEKHLEESNIKYQTKKVEFNFNEINEAITTYFSSASNCNGPNANSFIGLHYERYVATLLFKKGYRICYNGAISGYDDGGIDLIAYKNKTNNILIQCKYYSQRSKKKINEKLIKKIKDNMKKYKDKHPDENYKMSLFSSKNQCNKAKSIANKRPVLEYNAGVFIKDRFPIIKFNRETGKFFYPEPYKIWSKKMEDARRKHLHYVDEYDKIEADPSKIDLCLNVDELKTSIDNYNRNNLVEGTLPI